MVVRKYEDELKYLEKVSPYCWKIKKGFQPNMNVCQFESNFYPIPFVIMIFIGGRSVLR